MGVAKNIADQRTDGLFWYPALNCPFDFEKPFDKGLLLNSYIKYYLARLQKMFKYTGLPETIPQKWLEHYLLVNGSCVFIKDGDDLIATTGGMGGMPDRYYIPTKYIVSNPYVEEKTRKTYTIGEDCVLIRNDTYSQGLIPMLTRYCVQMVENDVSMNTALILVRAMLTVTATDNQSKESVELWFKRLRKGELGAIGELPSMVGNQDRSINVTPFQSVASTLTDLIEAQQYHKASLFNEIGLNANYNMKRESINSNESQLNDDMLTPFIDDMLDMRKEALEEVNAMFGTNISVEFNSAWEDNEIEADLARDQMESETEVIDHAAEETPSEVTTEEDAADQTDDEVIEEETPEGKTNDTQTVVDAIETAAEVIADAIEGDTEPQEETEEDKEGED